MDISSEGISFPDSIISLILGSSETLVAINTENTLLFETSASSSEMRKRALELLKAVDLEDKINQKPTKLSGGERQRVAIARALVNHPSIILADEPTGSLDSKTGEVILNLLKDLHSKENVTLVMVTHEPYVGNMAERIVTVLDGKCQNINKT